jgi:predicted ATPase
MNDARIDSHRSRKGLKSFVMLNRVYIDNYKCFVNFDFRPREVQLLLGDNGTGKSTFLEVLALLRDFSIRGMPTEGRFAGATLNRWQTNKIQHFRLEACSTDGEYSYELTVEPWGSSGKPRVLHEVVELQGKPLFRFEDGDVHLFNDRHEDKVTFSFDWNRSALATVVERKDNTKLTWFKKWLGAFTIVQVDPHRMSARAEMEETWPAPDLSNFAAWCRHLVQENSRATQDLRETLTGAIKSFDSLDLKEAGQNIRILKVGFNKVGSNFPIEYSFDEISDGQRALIGLYALLYFGLQKDSLLCIDEPDNFIALQEIQLWLNRLLDRAEELNAQVFLVSHHPELLNQLAAEHGIKLARAESGPVTAEPFKGIPGSKLPPAEQIARNWNHNE